MDFDKVASLFRAYKSVQLCEDLHPKDVMHSYGGQQYFSIGESALRVILSSLLLTWRSEIKRILDLPCGHGRIARHLRAAFPQAELFVCDIDSEGVEFCSSRFSAQGILSEPDLLKVDLPKDLDLIWVGSLFTHVDQQRTQRWLEHLCNHLHEHGILIATFHGFFTRDFTEKPFGGVDWEKITVDFDRVGFGYDIYRTVDMGNYGTSLSKPSKLMDMVALIQEVRIVGYTERGWANNQDVLVIAKNDRRRLLRARS